MRFAAMIAFVSDSPETDDLVRAFLRLAVEAMPQPVDVNAVLRIERRLRVEIGGARYYVPESSAADRLERAWRR
jgi:hypothetical protein